MNDKLNLFEKVSMLHENMEKIDDREFGIALKMVRYFH
jgi:hypothetical protein